MTRDEVLAMKPGRELDALVAEKVMGWAYGHPCPGGMDCLHWVDEKGNVCGYKPPQYSTDNATALVVAIHLQKQGYVVCIELLPYEKTSVGVYEADPANQIAYAKAQTPAEAICKAALLAVMGLD